MVPNRFCLFLFATLFASGLFAQGGSQKPENRANYYGQKVNFGFYLGINRTNFDITPVNNWQSIAGDSLKTILSSPSTGFNLGIVSELRIHEYVTLRFLPDIAFGQRNLEYHFEGNDTFDIQKKVESTFLDFPLDAKIRSKRFGNFAAYMLGGGKYTLDLASQKDVNNTGLPLAQQVVKLAKNDWAVEAGAGVDFFLPYFKFGIELKASLGLRNMLVRDPGPSILSSTIDSLHSKVFLISFTFEG
ncbi:MAG TPA: porin family protein [Bacteroidia bacterium]|nr:porin family protein [Bacteroidia bacterium]